MALAWVAILMVAQGAFDRRRMHHFVTHRLGRLASWTTVPEAAPVG